MRRAALLLLFLAACSKKPAPTLPVINSFTVDNANPEAGDLLTFTWDVSGATSLLLWPEPGAVTGNSISFAPHADGVFVLEATNAAGTVQQPITVKFVPTPAIAVSRFTALPGQVLAGGEVTLSWSLNSSAVSATLSDGSSNPPVDVLSITSLKVHPAATTVYTLTALAKAGHTPASATAQAVARVTPATAIASFTATPSAITQGDASTLAWDGNASSWAVDSTQLGPLKSLVVRPAATTTYTLHASGAGGSATLPVTVTVTPHAASSFTYTNPPAGAQPLSLTASCASVTVCRLAVVAASAVGLRGVALNLPIDSTKVAVTDSSSPLSAFKVTLGAGPLEDTLVLGAAKPGTGTAPAADTSFAAGDEIASFTLTLQPAGGRGAVFDGTGARSWLQSAARTSGVIAIGTLEAN